MDGNGWAFFVKGKNKSRFGKNHLLKNWASRCGIITISIDDQNKMVFVPLKRLFTKKTCKRCFYLDEEDEVQKNVVDMPRI